VGGAYAAERYTYVSYFGLFYAIVQWVDGAGFREVGHRVLAAVLLLFAFVSWARVSDWRDTDSILGDIVYKNEGNSRNSLVHYHWGQYYTYRQQWPEAADQYSRSLTIDPRYFPSLLRRGEALDAMGRYKEAMADYSVARGVDPKSALLYNNMGWTRFGLGDPATALSLIDTAIALDSQLATAYNNRGWIKLQQKDSVAALNDFDAAIRLQPGFAKSYYNRALVKLYRGDVAGALADYSTIIRMYPNESLAWFNRGLVHLQLLDKQAAARDMHRAADLGNRNAASILTAELRGM
jgi:tetratricopeptide (TPR) repeat protein